MYGRGECIRFQQSKFVSNQSFLEVSLWKHRQIGLSTQSNSAFRINCQINWLIINSWYIYSLNTRKLRHHCGFLRRNTHWRAQSLRNRVEQIACTISRVGAKYWKEDTHSSHSQRHEYHDPKNDRDGRNHDPQVRLEQ